MCRCSRLPGKHDVGVGVICARPRGAPLDCVDFFTVSLEVVDAGLLLHTPDLCATATYEYKLSLTFVACSY